MSDSAASSDNLQPTLSFPLGEITCLAENLSVIAVPINYPPGHINCYLLDSDDGVTIVDTGHLSRAAIKTWDKALQEPLLKNRVTRIYLTHGHPDHCGLAEWLHEKTGALVLIHAEELDAVRRLWRGGVFEQEAQFAFYRRWGVPEEYLPSFIQLIERFRIGMTDLDVPLEYLKEADHLSIGDLSWQVIEGRGHTPCNISLYCADLAWMVTGDHLLPRIIPNVSVWWGAADNPLQDYLDSVQRLKTLNCDTYFPSHGGIGKQYHKRLQNIEDFHGRRLDMALEFCRGEYKTAMECIKPVLRLPANTEMISLVSGQVFAILNCLVAQGQVERIEEAGVYKFRTK